MSVEWPTLLREISARLFARTEGDAAAREATWLQAARAQGGTEAAQAEARTRARWLGFEGASEEAIAARERELGVQLPEDYRAFLRASDGFLSMDGFPHGLCTLSPVARIGWLRDVDGGLIDAWTQEFGATDPDDIPDEWFVRREELERTLVVGRSDGQQCVLLLPPGPGPQYPNWNQWEVWLYDSEAGFEMYCDSQHTFLDCMSRALAGGGALAERSREAGDDEG